MKTRKTLLASMLSVLALAGQTAFAQYGVPGGPYSAETSSPQAHQVAHNPQLDQGYVQTASGQEPAPALGAATSPMSDVAGCASCGDMSCDVCCPDPCCAAPFGCKFGLFGEFLYLRPRNADINFATPFNGPIAPGIPPVQAGRQGILDHDFAPAFRAGVHIPVDEMTEVQVVYSRFEETTNDAITVLPPDVIRSPIVHPGSLAANTDYLDATGASSLRWNFVDIDYRHIFFCTPQTRINYLAGVRLAEYEQQLDTVFTNVGTIDTVNTDIDFYGAGPRLGLEALRMHANGRLFVYGNSAVSFVAGEFRADYLQTSTADPIVAQTFYSNGRIVPMLDLELGAGWMSANQNIQIRSGYLISSWYNTVRNDNWIAGVQTNNMRDLSRATSFDGLTARVTVLW